MVPGQAWTDFVVREDPGRARASVPIAGLGWLAQSFRERVFQHINNLLKQVQELA
jgi:hypothetical protein